MSFLSGITNIFTGGGLGGTVLRTVALGYVLNKVSSSATKQNNIGTISNVPNAPGIDNGVRLQVEPGANQKIPVLYGSAYFGGIISEAKMSNSNQRMTYVVTLAEQTGDLYSNSAATSYSFNSLRWNDQEVYFQSDGVTIDYTIDRQGNKDESLNNLVKVYFYAGDSTSSSQIFPDGHSGTAVNAYDQVPGWNSAYAMNDLVFAVIEVNYSAERNIKGIGDVKFQVTSSMNKPGDVIYDYLTDNIYGANIAVAEIDTTSLTALNTFSSNSVDYTDEGGSQTLTNRYQINGLVNTDKAVMQNVEEITNTAGSWLSYSVLSGKWGVIINREGTSVASFDDSNILGSISLGGTGLQDLYNSVKVEFPNRDIKDSRDYTTISIPDSDRNANEQDNTLNLTYNLTNEPVQAQMLGFIELKQSRIDLVVTFSTDYSTINLNAGDIIDITNSKLGFTNKLFRIITISEQQGEEGLRTEITALEYDDTVYDEDFTRFTRTFNNELVTVGNISVPGTPTITKYENDARPRIEVSTTAPSSGIIEGMEYWLSNDTGLGEAQRSYRLIATRVAPNGNTQVRGTFANDETVTLEYDTIGTSNFVVKTRAYNTTTVGPFSANSAITSFTSTQVTNAIDPNTEVQDGLGGLATTLGIITLLNNLDELFGGNASPGSMFEKIFDIFSDETGYDIVGETTAGNLTVSSQLGVKNEGNLLTNAVSTIDFVGNGITANVANISQVTVSVDGTIAQLASDNNLPQEDVNNYITSEVEHSIPTSYTPDISTGQHFLPCVMGANACMGNVETRSTISTHEGMWYTTASNINSPSPYFSPTATSTGTLNLYIRATGEVLSASLNPTKWDVTSSGTSGYYEVPEEVNTNWTNNGILDSGVSAHYPGKLYLYYSICDYDPNLEYDEQDWSNWTYIAQSQNTGINYSEYKTQSASTTGGSFAAGIPTLYNHGYSGGSTRGTRGTVDDTDYIHPPSGSSYCPGGNMYSGTIYDESVSDGIGKTGRNNCIINTRLQITLAADQMLAFGVSCFPIQSNVAFSGNTIISYTDYSSGYFLDYLYPGFTTGTPQIPSKTFFSSYYVTFGSDNTFPDYGFPTSIDVADFGTLTVPVSDQPANVHYSQVGILCPTIQVFNT